MKYLIIDIRKSDEVYNKHLIPSNNYSFYNIPMNMIRFNKDNIIKHLEYFDEIYIVCNSGIRSTFIKNKYFSNIQNIKVNNNIQFKNFNYGENLIKINDKTNIINIRGSNSFNLYSIMRITQLILGTSILILGGYTYHYIKNKNVNTLPLIILLFLGLNAVINALTSTCTVSIILRNYLN